MNWLDYKNNPVTEVPKNAHGFVYLITLDDGKMYIGKKN